MTGKNNGERTWRERLDDVSILINAECTEAEEMTVSWRMDEFSVGFSGEVNGRKVDTNTTDIAMDIRTALRTLTETEAEADRLRNRMAGLDNRIMLKRDVEAMGYMKLPVGKDGKPIRLGETVYGGDGTPWEVFAITDMKSHPVYGIHDGSKRDLKPEWLTHERPKPTPMDANGVECRIGDTVWLVENGNRGKVIGIEGNGSINVAWRFGVTPCDDPRMYTHVEPESWTKLDEDAMLGIEEYRKTRCLVKGDAITWPQVVRRDIVRRAKALAGVDEG